MLVDRYFKGFDIPTVSCNHFAAGYKITAKFLAMGRSHILYVTEPPTVATTIEHRLNGFKKAIADKNFYRNDCSILYVEHSDAFLVELRRFLLAHPETDAVITTSGQLSSLTLRGLKSLGREPGTDILFAVFDEEMLSAERVNEFPYLQINQNPREIGSSAARILHDILRGTMQKKNKNLLIPSELVPKNDAVGLFGT